MRRRTFLTTSLVSGLGPRVLTPALAAQAGSSQAASIESKFFRISVDPDKGTFSAWYGKEAVLVSARAVGAGANSFALEGLAKTVWREFPSKSR